MGLIITHKPKTVGALVSNYNYHFNKRTSNCNVHARMDYSQLFMRCTWPKMCLITNINSLKEMLRGPYTQEWATLVWKTDPSTSRFVTHSYMYVFYWLFPTNKVVDKFESGEIQIPGLCVRMAHIDYFSPTAECRQYKQLRVETNVEKKIGW